MKLIQILKSDIVMGQDHYTKLSIYLMKQQPYSNKDKISNSEQQSQYDPLAFIQKHTFSTEICLNKSQMKKPFLSEIEQKCKNIFTMKLISDQYDQKNQIQDIDLTLMKMFNNISVLELKQSAITDNSIQLIRDSLPNIKQLNITGCYMLTDRGIKLLGQCGLVTIILDQLTSLKEQTVIQLIKMSNNLNYLQLKQCDNITDSIFIMAYEAYRQHSSTLKWLQISSDYGIDLYINKLTYLTSSNPIQQITDEQLQTLIGQKPPQYTGLFFENCQQLTKVSLQLITNKCKGLKRLALSKFVNLTDRLMQDVSLSLSELVFLDLNCCYNITNNGLYYVARYLDLQYLILEKCYSITDEGLTHFILQIGNKASNSPQKKKYSSLQKRQQKKKYTDYKPPLSHRYHKQQLRKSRLVEINQQQSTLHIKLKHLNIAHCNKITDESLSLLCRAAPYMQYLNLSYCDQITNASIQDISEVLVNLEYLNLNHCQGLTDCSISMLATRLSRKMKVLQIEWCQISQNCIRLIAQNLSNLRVLNVSYCPSVLSEQVQVLPKNIPKLNTLKLQSCSKINEQAFIKLSSLRQLKTLCIKQCVQANDTFIKLVTTNNKHLSHLDISWCTEVTDKGLFSIAKNCYNLKYLNLNGCVEITDEGIQWLSATVSQIQYLNLTLCSRLTDLSLIQITNNMKSLKHLYLCQLEQLTDISIATISNLDKLQQLMLMGCVNITNSSLVGLMYNLQKLRELNISQCRSVEGKKLRKICQFMANIKILEISQIQIDDHFLDQLITYCQKLTQINLCYCNQISDQAVLRLLEKIPRLEKIDIQNTNITARTKEKLVYSLSARSMANIVSA